MKSTKSKGSWRVYLGFSLDFTRCTRLALWTYSELYNMVLQHPNPPTPADTSMGISLHTVRVTHFQLLPPTIQPSTPLLFFHLRNTQGLSSETGFLSSQQLLCVKPVTTPLPTGSCMFSTGIPLMALPLAGESPPLGRTPDSRKRALIPGLTVLPGTKVAMVPVLLSLPLLLGPAVLQETGEWQNKGRLGEKPRKGRGQNAGPVRRIPHVSGIPI